MYSADYAVERCLSVRPSHSVCHTPVFCRKRLNISWKFFSPSGSQTILVFSIPNGMVILLWRPPNGGGEWKWYEIITIFDQYLEIKTRSNIEPLLLWKANRKPHPSFRMVLVWMILSDLYPRFQGHDYSTSNNSKTVQHRAILAMADQQKVVYHLSNGAIFNDLERPLTPVSRSRHSLTLNISETVRHTVIFSMEY